MTSENQVLGADNTELRLQSLEGFEMARTAEKLSTERQTLSIDLADKAKAIKQLLSKNESLKDQLRTT